VHGSSSYRQAVMRSLALGLLALAATASAASAVIVRLPHGKVLSYLPVPGSATTVTPFDEVLHNLDYNGGPVMASNTNYAVYWDPSGAPAYPSDYQPGLDQFFEDLAHDSGGHENVDSVSSQYNDAAGEFANYDSHFGGALLDTDPYPANGCTQATICLTDLQIRAELASYLKAHSLPIDLAHEYFVLTPPGVESCFEAAGSSCSAGTPHPAYCAYHGGDQLGGGKGVIVYANDPYVAGSICDDGNHPNGTTSDATISGGLSHEHNESITDPEPNNAWTDWATGGSTGYEVGDKCRTFSAETEFGTPLGTAPDGAKYNQVINGHLYWYQQEWSDQGHKCVQRFTLSGEQPKAAYTFTSDEEEATFDASGSTAPGGVAYYDWQLNEYVGEKPIETTSPTFKWGNTKGVFRVALTVFAKDGTSAGTMHLVNIGKIAVPTVTKVAPVKGPAAGATTVTITGTNLSGGVEAVKFGSTPATGFTVVSPTKITATSPPSVGGMVDVTVTTYYGTSKTSSSDHFTFTPSVTKVSPSSGSKAGGTSVTVTGTGFGPGTGTIFKFGTTIATSVNCSSLTTCTLVSPAHKAGIVEVKATVNAVSSPKDAPADRFTYN
jgi:hypothetical protein